MKVCGKDIQVQGGLIRIARLKADGFEFLEDPEALRSWAEKSIAVAAHKKKMKGKKGKTP